MAIETERRVAKENLSRIERVLPEELHPLAGDPAEKLKLLTHIIPEHFAQSLERIVRETSANVQLSHTLRGDPDQTLTIRFLKHNADRTFNIALEGDLTQLIAEVPRGIPLIAQFPNDKEVYTAYRKVNNQAEETIASEGKILMPGDAILILMKGKKIRLNYTLPKEKFPNGGKVTAITVPDVPSGFEIKNGDIIGYIEPIN
ncbi:MAG: hypothetical protein HYT11_00100 [Candidatus Levybacteria bacterium]|nr:hypothetical protein [Candidatus Levybacteria bacterium]